MKILLSLLVAASAVIIIANLFSMILGDREKGDPEKIAVAMVSCAENSTFDHTANYSFIEDIGDGAGYTGGIIGFTTMTGDMLHIVRDYCEKEDDPPLKKYIPALTAAVGTDKTKGLGKGFVKEWQKAGKTENMRKVQDSYRDRLFLDPAFDMIRKAAMKRAKTPAKGGGEKEYLKEFLRIRENALKKLDFKVNLSRIEAQKKLVEDEEFEMLLPLEFTMYGHDFELTESDLI